MQVRTKIGTSTVSLVIVFTLAVFCLLDVASAAYKKPPFNGSIFGKRANSITDYDIAGRTLASLCEIASEACTSWFPESNK